MARALLTLCAGAAAFLWTSLAAGLTYVPVSDETLVDQADLIVVATVGAPVVDSLTGSVATTYDLTIRRTLKGEPRGGLEVRFPGGLDRANGVALELWGIPQLATGTPYLLFLTEHRDQYQLLHLNQGLLVSRGEGEERVFYRALADGGLSARWLGDPAVSPDYLEAPRHGERLLSWIRDRVDGTARPADYLLPTRAGHDSRMSEKFTLLLGGSGNPAFRWFLFDEESGARLRWFRHADGQAGVARGGRRAFRQGLKAWSTKQAGTPVQLLDGGKTRQSGGFREPDGQSTILFSDLNNIFGLDFDCDRGGALAAGGFSMLAPDPRDWKGIASREIVEGEIVMNDGVSECLGQLRPALAEAAFAHVYAHEIGHTLGLGHSCGDGRTVPCETSELLAGAVMRSTLEDIRGARLNDDDLAGLRFLYDPSFFAVPCNFVEPGGKNFCKRCGPCGPGQGDCRRDRQCAGNLQCVKDAGEAFGFESSVNVCLAPD